MKNKFMVILLVLAFAPYATAADLPQTRNINLGKEALVSLSNPNLDDLLAHLPVCSNKSAQGRFGIGGESIHIAMQVTNAILASNYLNINSFTHDELSRFLICVSTMLKIQNVPGSLSNDYDNFGCRKLSENIHVSYNDDSFVLRGFKSKTPVELDSTNLLTAYFLLKDQAQRDQEIDLAQIKSEIKDVKGALIEEGQQEIDNNFMDKYSVAIGKAILLTKGMPAAQHIAILKSDSFPINGEHELRKLTDDEASKIMYWIYEGTLEDFKSTTGL